MTLIFILLLLLAIWAAARMGGVRRSAPGDGGKAAPPRHKPELRDAPEQRPDDGFRSGGGRFGGGGASGGWEDGAPEDRHKD